MSRAPTSYTAAREAAALADRSERGTLIVTGGDRASFLHGLLTNDILALTPGRGCYAAWLTPQGRLVTDMRVLPLADRILLDVRAADAGALAERLDRLVFSEDVHVRRATGFEQMRLAGPRAASILASALEADTPDLAALPEYGGIEIPRADGTIVVTRDDELGVPSLDVLASAAGAGDLRRALGAIGVPALDPAASETLRIEAGRPLFGVDMDGDTIPLEAGIEDRAISFSKGCYVGQEVIVRVTTRGQGRVARKLVGLLLEGSRVPARGDAVYAGDRDIGRVTSATWSPGLGTPIALAYVHRDFSGPSTRVAVGAAPVEPAEVTPLPFALSGR